MLETVSSPQGNAASHNSEEFRRQVEFVPPELKPIDGVSSYVYEGVVRHRRNQHARNHFNFSVFYFLLDLDELDTVFNWTPFSANTGSGRPDRHATEASGGRTT